MSRRNKKSAQRSNRLKETAKRLAAYSAAAAATLAAGGTASANEVVWDIPDVTTNSSTPGISFDMVTGGAIEATYDQQFYFYAEGNFRLHPSDGGYLYGPAYTTASPRAVLGFAGTGTSNITPRAGGSSSVKASDNFVISGPWYRNYYGYLNWSDGQTGFAGIRFQLDADTHYGWAQITRVDSDNFTLHGFGYNDTPDAASHPVNTVVPEPSSMLLLAAGAAGLVGWRRRRTG
jgi:hypothetical protein